MTFAQISDEIKNGVDYVVGYRQDDSTAVRASSIIKISADGSFKILRK